VFFVCLCAYCICVFLFLQHFDTVVNDLGKVLMLTSPDNPYVVLPLLHARGTALQGLLSGYYKLTGDRVSVTVCSVVKYTECFFAI